MSCCKPSEDHVRDNVKQYYGETLQKTSDLKTSACTTAGPPPKELASILAKIPDEVVAKYYGCGTPIPFGINGLDVLDLGSGSGRDVYLVSALVGESGSSTGVDMTDEQLDVAKRHTDEFIKSMQFKQSNMHFKKGYIELLSDAGIESNSMDLVISNCVINLSPNKPKVLQEVARVLREGGELYFSDVYADRRLPESVSSDPILHGECIGGALYVEDFKRICRQVGLGEPRELSSSYISVDDERLADLVGNTKFYSITYRCFKLKDVESGVYEEDYGQVAKYLGGIPGHKHGYALDEEYYFETDKLTPVGGNTATILTKSWLAKYFEVLGDTSKHYGPFHTTPKEIMPMDESSGGDAGGNGGSCCG